MHIQNDVNFLNKSIYTDKATFTTEEMFNRRNRQGQRPILIKFNYLIYKDVGQFMYGGNWLIGLMVQYCLKETLQGKHIQNKIKKLLGDIYI